MGPNIHLVQHKTTSKYFCRAFAAGSGGKIVTEYTPGPWAGFGAPLLMSNLNKNIKAGHDFYFGDHAYFGRGVFYRVTKNAFQHDGRGPPDYDRLKPFYESAKPWAKDGKNVILCTQTQKYYNRFGIPDWQHRIERILREYTDRPIIIRAKGTARPLQEDLKDAHCIVCCTSNVAVESIMEGVPVITTGDCAASRMGLHDPANVENLFYPDDRMEWAASLAANQWNLNEISQGKCWEAIE